MKTTTRETRMSLVTALINGGGDIRSVEHVPTDRGKAIGIIVSFGAGQKVTITYIPGKNKEENTLVLGMAKEEYPDEKPEGWKDIVAILNEWFGGEAVFRGEGDGADGEILAYAWCRTEEDVLLLLSEMGADGTITNFELLAGFGLFSDKTWKDLMEAVNVYGRYPGVLCPDKVAEADDATLVSLYVIASDFDEKLSWERDYIAAHICKWHNLPISQPTFGQRLRVCGAHLDGWCRDQVGGEVSVVVAEGLVKDLLVKAGVMEPEAEDSGE